MVDCSEAQLFTIEGVAAAILMVLTAYLIINSTYLLTPGDTHISDMQLEQLGNDILKLMDTSVSFNATSNDTYIKKQSDLEFWLSENTPESYGPTFNNTFQYYANISQAEQPLKLNASFYSWNAVNDQLVSHNFLYTPSTGREHYVTITRWVYLNDPKWDDAFYDHEPKTVLLEVTLWRD